MVETEAAARARLTLVIGGARSGKSRYAESLVTALPKPWVYLATAEARDDEMKARIAEHQARRAEGWETVEAPLMLAEALHAAPAGAAVLVDCLTLWLTNAMLGAFDLEKAMAHLSEALGGRDAATVLVANEVGLGIVPDNAVARRFRDAQGVLNQRLAAQADRVVLMVAGLPLTVKGQS
jgi:adenosylcobinamide kinase/adenosylcobinamide-phosphate guanylyltransferase